MYRLEVLGLDWCSCCRGLGDSPMATFLWHVNSRWRCWLVKVHVGQATTLYLTGDLDDPTKGQEYMPVYCYGKTMKI